MPKTNLPAHMDSVRQKWRPKHQLLILKCYPRLPKNSAADVKPNGSELSYLLYYASTRRSKLQKVGAFLEKKTASDVYRWQSARVLVTLQILTALLENKVVGAGNAFSLIAPSVLRIIKEILQNTNDISLIEASLVTFDVFCKHQDHAILAADHQYRELYENVVGQYAAFANKSGTKKIGKATNPVAVQDAIRLRESGLGAIKSVLLSDALAFESGRQLLNVVVPAILSNLHGDDAAYFEHLVRLGRKNEDEEKDKAMNRRQSMATVRTYTGLTEGSSEADPRAAEGTAQDADALAEEGVAVLALECLKATFNIENRAQVRSGTGALLNYLSDMQYRQRPQTMLEKPPSDFATDSWAKALIVICTASTPVQDRFILLVTAVETMVRLPIRESDMRQHLLYTTLIDTILRSDLNLIGLQIMDVLLGLISQTLRVLQMSSAAPTTSGSQVASSNEELKSSPSAGSGSAPSESRLQLIERLKACIADLATHVYYTDQISDMIAAILLRLKPNPTPTGQPNPVATAAAIEEPKSTVNEMASNSSLPTRERSSSTTSGFFAFDAARQIALEAVRDIIEVANSSRSLQSGGVAESRIPVHISIWEGTQWLLRDPSQSVRRAYVDALVTWLENETKKSDMRVHEPSKPSTMKKGAEPQSVNGTLARRAVSNASAKVERKEKKTFTTFLQLLHLASYENALQFAATSEADILFLHRLLVGLVQKLGINAAQSGLPMMMALQEEIARLESPIGKVRVGSLVHGYLWTLTEVFDFKEDEIGRGIQQEISRRKQHRLWVRPLSYPPLPLDKISTYAGGPSRFDSEFVAREELLPFDLSEQLADRITESYTISVASPAPSAPGSPGRNYIMPALERSSSSYLTAKDGLQPPAFTRMMSGPRQLLDPAVNAKVKERLMSKWSKEDCLAAIQASAPKSVSLSGSHSNPVQVHGTTAMLANNHRQLLAATNVHTTRNGSVPNSNKAGTAPSGQGQSQHRQQAFAALAARRLNSQSPDRRPSASTNGKQSSSHGARAPLRIEELKRVLTTGGTMPAINFTTGIMGRIDAGEETASDSLVDAEEGELGSEEGGGYSASSLRGGKTDVRSLLESIHLEKGPRSSGVSAMTQPPY